MSFSVVRSSQPVLKPSSINVTLADKGPLAPKATVLNVSERAIDETVRLTWGKASTILDRYSAATVRLEGASGIEWDIELRAYDDGVALRYGLPEQDSFRDFVIEDEAIEFRLAGDPSVLFMKCNGFTTSHECPTSKSRCRSCPTRLFLKCRCLPIGKEDRRRRSSKEGCETSRGCTLSGSVVATRRRCEPAWRRCRRRTTPRSSERRHNGALGVILLADSAGTLIESNLPVLLNDPPKGDFSWAKPGKSTWHWWHGGDEGLAKRGGMNFATHKPYIDFLRQARNRLPCRRRRRLAVACANERRLHAGSRYGHPHAAARRSICRESWSTRKQKGVGIRLWVHWKPLSEKLDEAFAKYERWGIKGLMVDFMDRDDQEMVEWQERCSRVGRAGTSCTFSFTARTSRRGEQRTFPNLFNREGVLNLEYLKWSDACSPPHSVNVAYTRLLAGPVDYHLGGFRAARADEFKPRDVHADGAGHALPSTGAVRRVRKPDADGLPTCRRRTKGKPVSISSSKCRRRGTRLASSPAKRASTWSSPAAAATSGTRRHHQLDAAQLELPLNFLGDGKL